VSHATARLTVHGRGLLIWRVLGDGWTVAAAAESMGISRATAYKWLARYEAEGKPGLENRSSRPHRSPGRTPQGVEQRILKLRQREKLGPHAIGDRLGMAQSSCYAVLRRHRMNRLAWMDRPTGQVIRCERERPGDLGHMDVKKLARRSCRHLRRGIHCSKDAARRSRDPVAAGADGVDRLPRPAGPGRDVAEAVVAGIQPESAAADDKRHRLRLKLRQLARGSPVGMQDRVGDFMGQGLDPLGGGQRLANPDGVGQEIAVAVPLGLSIATLSPDLDSDQDGSRAGAAVTRIRMLETSVPTSEPGGHGVAQSGVGAISHPGDVPVRADHHGSRGAD
jgi:hypothetical protein